MHSQVVTDNVGPSLARRAVTSAPPRCRPTPHPPAFPLPLLFTSSQICFAAAAAFFMLTSVWILSLLSCLVNMLLLTFSLAPVGRSPPPPTTVSLSLL